MEHSLQLNSWGYFLMLTSSMIDQISSRNKLKTSKSFVLLLHQVEVELVWRLDLCAISTSSMFQMLPKKYYPIFLKQSSANSWPKIISLNQWENVATLLLQQLLTCSRSSTRICFQFLLASTISSTWETSPRCSRASWWPSPSLWWTPKSSLSYGCMNAREYSTTDLLMTKTDSTSRIWAWN